jgi:hypothetical protein
MAVAGALHGVVLQVIICSVLCTAIRKQYGCCWCCTWCCIAGYNLFCTLYSYRKTIWPVRIPLAFWPDLVFPLPSLVYGSGMNTFLFIKEKLPRKRGKRMAQKMILSRYAAAGTYTVQCTVCCETKVRYFYIFIYLKTVKQTKCWLMADVNLC